MSVETRRAVSGIWTGFTIVGVTPGSSPERLRQQAGWGYPALFAGEAAPEVIAEYQPFVYRRRCRLRARKRRLS